MADRYTKGFDGTQGMKRHKGIRIGTLYCSKNDITGDVTLAPIFDTMSDMEKIDLLNDIIGLLTTVRDIIMSETTY